MTNALTGGAVQSMTGFAAIQGADPGRWTWEIRSVNGKGLDVRYRGPSGFESLEPGVRERVASRFSRGSIQLSLNVQAEDGSGAIRINRAALDDIVAVAREYSGSPEAPVAVEELLAIRGVVELVESAVMPTDDLKARILSSLEEALDALLRARLGEGAATAAVLEQRLTAIEGLTAKASANESRTPEAIRARLTEQVSALMGAAPALDPDRLHQEAVLLATRADISEELDRLTAHIAAARDLLAEGGPIGRRLDFLAQEFNRETNTLCSKANHRSLTAIGLEMKAVVDQFREQIQNIE